MSVADSLYRSGSYREARQIWTDRLAESWESGDSAQAARILTLLGLAARQLGEYEESRRLGSLALELKLRFGMREDLFRSYNALGLVAWTRGDLAEAAEMFEQASKAAEAVGDDLGVAKAAANMAQVHNERGEPYRAREGFARLADASRAAGDTVSLGRALINLAMLDVRLGDPLPALATLEEARQLGRASGDAEAEENALGQLATAFSAVGRPQQAMAALDTALSLAEDHGLRRQVAEDWKLLGDLFAEAGDQRRALDHYARARAMNEELGLIEESGNASANEARSHLVLGNADSASARAREALELHRAGGYVAAELDDQLLLAEILFDQGDRSGATNSLAAASGIADYLDTPTARARVALVSARLWDRVGRPRDVLESLESAAEDLGRLGESDSWEPDALRARAYGRLGLWTAAEAAGREAIAAIERFRGGYAAGALRTSFLSARAEAYADLVVVLLQQGKVAEAFEVADAARGRALLDHLAAARTDIELQPRSAEHLLQLDRLLREIDALVDQLRALDSVPPRERGAPHEASSRFITNRVEALRQQYEARLALVAGSPDLSLLGAPIAPVAAVQAALRPDEAILEYLISASGLQVFVLRSDGLTHAAVDLIPETAASRVRLARELTSRPDRGLEAGPVLRALFRDLLSPVLETEALEGVRRLIVVPHGPLVYLPFAALMDESGVYVVTRFEIAVLPSAAALPALRGNVRGYRGTTSVGMALAPIPDALPATRGEVVSVRRALGGDALLGPAASERAARRGLQTARVLHIASHGWLNPVNPMFSSIELAPGTGRGPDDDGRLEVHELLGLRIESELVYLSGCETGRGGSWATGFDRADDYVTLAQAFLYAGARNVVATLWRVEDAAAAEVAESFYRARGGEDDPVVALAKAQRAMLANPRYEAPYYWASYEVLGAGGEIE